MFIPMFFLSFLAVLGIVLAFAFPVTGFILVFCAGWIWGIHRLGEWLRLPICDECVEE